MKVSLPGALRVLGLSSLLTLILYRFTRLCNCVHLDTVCDLLTHALTHLHTILRIGCPAPTTFGRMLVTKCVMVRLSIIAVWQQYVLFKNHDLIDHSPRLIVVHCIIADPCGLSLWYPTASIRHPAFWEIKYSSLWLTDIAFELERSEDCLPTMMAHHRTLT